ncbi:hypothetical protein [Lentzea guizhouensis]|nr:hypothetical protein [Lentzea guizhouensis]
MEQDRPSGDHEEVFRASSIPFHEVAALACVMVSITYALLVPAAADDMARAFALGTSIACAGYAVGADRRR